MTATSKDIEAVSDDSSKPTCIKDPLLAPPGLWSAPPRRLRGYGCCPASWRKGGKSGLLGSNLVSMRKLPQTAETLREVAWVPTAQHLERLRERSAPARRSCRTATSGFADRSRKHNKAVISSSPSPLWSHVPNKCTSFLQPGTAP